MFLGYLLTMGLFMIHLTHYVTPDGVYDSSFIEVIGAVDDSGNPILYAKTCTMQVKAEALAKWLVDAYSIGVCTKVETLKAGE